MSRKYTEAPIFRPSMEEFSDFTKFVESIHEEGIKHGIVKIIPPKEWLDMQKKLDFDKFTNVDPDLKIPNPIKQYPNGRKGIYELLLVEKKAMTIRDFKDMAETEKCDMPAQLKVEGAASNWTP